MHSIAAWLLAGLSVVTAVPLHDAPHNLHEKRHAEPNHWVKRSQVAGHVELPVRIGLVQSNLDIADELLMRVSSHDSPHFAQYYTADEVVDLFAPTKERIDAVSQWLHDAGHHSFGLSANKQWIELDMPVSKLEELLKTKYHHYDHPRTGKATIACDQYHVPAHVQEHVDYITPGLNLMAGGKHNSQSSKDKRAFRSAADKSFAGPIGGTPLSHFEALLLQQNQTRDCDNLITPGCIAGMYNITKATKKHAGNELGIFEEGDFYAPEDLAQFFALLAPNIPVTTEPILHGVDGGSAPGIVATGESDLDFQISYPIIYPQQSVLFQTDDVFYAAGVEGKGGFLNTFLDAIDGSYCTAKAFGQKGNSNIDPTYPDPNPAGYQGKLQCGVYKPTNVISISYGEQEDDLPTNYQQRQCAEFLKLGLQGTSVILASGDSGVAARAADDGNDNGCLGKGEVFNPDFPASCPYVSALGATYLPQNHFFATDREVAVTRFPSGGGFSNIYKRPKYQDSAVNGFFANHNPTYKSYSLDNATNNPTTAQTNGGRYNKAGRGYPDFSAVGDNVVVVVDGAPQTIGGTSASAPVFAAILNRVNEERLAAGKKTVGFVNPTLYAHPEVFHDILVGNNPGCGTQGFAVGKGWDPVTGLGTPNYPAILKLYMSLP